MSACSTPETGTPETPGPVRGGAAPETASDNAAAPGQALQAAAAANDGPEVRRLLESGANPDHR
ncbi:MAG: hypothetical protein ACRD08_16910, partial [Acidimicrobiales bacterium]